MKLGEQTPDLVRALLCLSFRRVLLSKSWSSSTRTPRLSHTNNFVLGLAQKYQCTPRTRPPIIITLHFRLLGPLSHTLHISLIKSSFSSMSLFSHSHLALISHSPQEVSFSCCHARTCPTTHSGVSAGVPTHCQQSRCRQDHFSSPPTRFYPADTPAEDSLSGSSTTRGDKTTASDQSEVTV